MIDETVVAASAAETTAGVTPIADALPVVRDGEIVAAPNAHESLLHRIEDAIERFGSPAHALDWIKQEIARFRAG